MSGASGVWVFGYGSLVSPASFGHTIGRTLTRDHDFHPAELTGFGRRWNYGVMTSRGETDEPDGTTRSWTIVALGLVTADHESVNGVVGWVGEHELSALDRRERNYDRVDVTDLVTAPLGGDDRVVTYVPRPHPVRWYEEARDRGEAAVERRYWDLVDAAFGDLGVGHRERFHATTPEPDIPIVAMRRDTVPQRHLAGEG